MAGRVSRIMLSLIMQFSALTLFAVEQSSFEGIASWYGAEFAGKKTASGEVFDPASFTAAHRTLPFGTTLRVTNTHNGKSVLVKVNDRGPFVSGRVLDVSRAAAEILDMITTGTAPIKAELVSDTTSSITASAMVPTSTQTPETNTVPTTTTTTLPTQEAVPAPASKEQDTAIIDDSAQMAPLPEPASEAEVAPEPPPEAAIPVAAPTTTEKEPQIPRFKPARLEPQAPEVGTSAKYRIQVGSYKIQRNAEEAFRRVKQAGYAPAYERAGEYLRVVIVSMTAEEVLAAADPLGQVGFSAVLVRLESR